MLCFLVARFDEEDEGMDGVMPVRIYEEDHETILQPA